jgi:hypothetical protein
MKVYNLSCELKHRFEGWFSSENDFNSQLAVNHIECPICENRSITRLPSAPRLNLSHASSSQPDPRDQLQAQLLDMVRNVMANTEDVGERFAEEARRIHYKETRDRSIRGIATVDECADLVEEGIDVVPLGLPPALKQPLH